MIKLKDSMKIFAALLTIFVPLVGLYKEYGVKFTLEFLFVMMALLLVIKFSKNSKSETKEESLSTSQNVLIKSKFGYVKTGDINQSVGTSTEIEDK